MNRCLGCILAAAITLVVVGCSPLPRLARGPIDLGSAPTVVRFAQPVHTQGPGWEFRFEFDRPGDSDHAGEIHATLVTSEGYRYALTEVRLDRQGERLVSQSGRLESDDATRAPSPPGHAPTFVAVELRTDVPVRLRALRGAPTGPDRGDPRSRGLTP
jgi:hypothetical protein